MNKLLVGEYSLIVVGNRCRVKSSDHGLGFIKDIAYTVGTFTWQSLKDKISIDFDFEDVDRLEFEEDSVFLSQAKTMRVVNIAECFNASVTHKASAKRQEHYQEQLALLVEEIKSKLVNEYKLDAKMDQKEFKKIAVKALKDHLIEIECLEIEETVLANLRSKSANELVKAILISVN